MPRFEPFPGIRYDTARVGLADVTAPPYDVIDADDRAALAARHPYNVVAVDCPVDDDAGDDGAGGDCYDGAARRLASWRAEGVLQQDATRSLYLYRMSFTDDAGRPRHTTGVIGALGLPDGDGSGEVLPHERTTPKARSDRLQLLRATRSNLSPVWGLSLAPGLSKLLDPASASPVDDWRDDDGVRHQLWVLDDDAAVTAIADAVASEPVVIADGHHRFETCVAYRDEQRAVGAGPGPHDLTMALIVELVDDELTVRPIHRLLSGLGASTDVGALLDRWFEVVPVPGPPPGDVVGELDANRELGLVTPEGFARLRPRHGDDLVGEGGLWTEALDRVRAELPPHEVAYQHGVEHVVAAVAAGAADAGVLLPPVSVAQIAATARAGARMPPKTTFFWPKPRTGLVFRSLS